MKQTRTSKTMRKILMALEQNARKGNVLMESPDLYEAIGRDVKDAGARGVVCRTLRNLQAQGFLLCVGKAYMLVRTLGGEQVTYHVQVGDVREKVS